MIRDLAAGGAPDLSAAYDVCIVGAGPAGITIARKLGAAGRRVLLLEGGGFEIEADSQEIYILRDCGLETACYLPFNQCLKKQKKNNK